MEYIFYYIVSLSSLVFSKKIGMSVFLTAWLVFVGFRLGVGVDWYITAEMFGRAAIRIDNPNFAFQGYNLFDSEIIYKIIATLANLYTENVSEPFLIIAALEVVLLSQILNNSANWRICVVVICAIFSVHYPMNATRQGLALISICAFAISNNRGSRWLTATIAMTAHWASLGIVTAILCRPKGNASIRGYFAVGFITILLILFATYNIDILALRFNVDANEYQSKGIGIKYLFSFICALIVVRISPSFPDGHPKLLHLWPPKLPQAGRLNYQLFGPADSDFLSW